MSQTPQPQQSPDGSPASTATAPATASAAAPAVAPASAASTPTTPIPSQVQPQSTSQPPSQVQPQGPPVPAQSPASQAQPQVQEQSSQPGPSAPKPEVKPDPQDDPFWAARRQEETIRRDRSLGELLVMLDGYKPLIPEEVTEYFLQRSGFDCNDPRIKRLLSLVAQKFISDLSRDAFHFSKLRVNGASQGRGRPAAGVDRNKVVLTMDDLSLALGEHGVNVKAPDYYL